MHVKVLCCVFAVYMCIWVAQGHNKVPVTVYYESLCPDSKKFFTSQLYPSLQTNLSQWVNLTLIPYGKSNQTKANEEEWQFTCHHGPYECQGNKIQACALNLIESGEKAPDAGFNPTTVAFINCLMDKVVKNGTGYDFPTKDCSEINNVRDYVKIENCAGHSDGSKYLAALGDATSKLEPPLKSVPTIVFEGKYKAQDSKKAQENFVQAVCQYIKENKPSECNSSATLTVSALALALVFLKQLF